MAKEEKLNLLSFKWNILQLPQIKMNICQQKKLFTNLKAL